ncbi:MAG: hypothetical protein Kow00117_18360 [Phototrophicales bacterium]
MAIDLYWDDEDQTVLLCVFNQGWTWEELFTTLNHIQQVTSQRDEEIGAMIVLNKGAMLPAGSIFTMETRAKAKKLLQMSAAGKGPIAIVGMNAMIQAIIQGFKMLDRQALNEVYFCDTAEEARTKLHQRLMSPNRPSSAL